MEPHLVQLGDDFPFYVASYDGVPSGEYEARFIYKEIFGDSCYDVAQLSDPRLIVDVGANIGLFTVYMKKKHPSCRLVAFEPAPDTFAVLQANLALHKLGGDGGGVVAHRLALGAEAGSGSLTFFPNLPGNSTLVPDEKARFRELLGKEVGTNFTDKMFGEQGKVEVAIRRLSDVLDEEHGGFEAIDLLKVDVEGAELSVLKGISEGHWGKIRNIVLETCDLSGEREELTKLLEEKGFSLESSKADWSPKGAQFYTIIARRLK
ncbi:Methyltransferase FkbM [Cordyceps fumosorosea ARSEF 2679]|uniref:Methyltransferase FkbM n=1 Tax=Cordyceps fumosorosea (strain ARSEF 2679) TaxID=1081104 RepID=A0A167LGS6_CORFA|nr:Methyltransferase FkbM [Cordyceps fumosorosea ARSEF 2679]OAA53072.1 Methyltransferase FkbM [Cordyceps fumosorosea ARSEF 2679]